MFDEITRILNHLMWIGSNALDLGAMAVFLYAFREREELMDVLRGGVAARACTRPTTARAASTATCPSACRSTANRRGARAQKLKRFNEWREGSMLDYLEAFADDFPQARRRVRNAAHRQPHLEAAHRRHRRGPAGTGAGLGHDRPDAARLRHRLGPAQEAALREVRRSRLRHPGRRATATATTATWCASTRCASPTASSSSASRG